EVRSQSCGASWAKVFQCKKEAKYTPEHWIDKGRLALEFPTICDKVRELGLGYVIVEPGECNLTL
ncbi:hypothetical protein HAX54_004531, partial [Datura stramonium]|nr:hypothetical protein [Datura stramonium]